jgi:predicted secreted protein
MHRPFLPVLVLSVFSLSLPAIAAEHTNEVLVLTSAATRVDTDTMRSRKAIEIQNLGPNAIYCAIGASADAVLTKSRRLSAGETWSFTAFFGKTVYCRAATADQITGAATIVTEIP